MTHAVPPLAAPLLPLLLCALAACGGDGGEPALRVGDVAYTDRELASVPAPSRDELARLTAFGLAVARGDGDELVRPLAEQRVRSALLERLAAEVALREAGLTEEQLRDAYLRDPEHELVVRHLVILSERWRSDRERAAARARAQHALERIRAGEDFAGIAAELSEEPGAAGRGGLLQPGRRGSWVSEFWDAASALEPGEVSGVIETEYGFHVLRLEERRAVPFDEARAAAVQRLVATRGLAGHAQAWAARETAGLEVRQEVMTSLRAGDLAETTAVASWPGGQYTAGEFRRFVQALEPEQRARLDAAAPDAWAGVVRSAARNALLADCARAMGLEPPADAETEAVREWRGKLDAWSQALGFARGQSPDEVKRTALTALGATRQSARIARAEVARLVPARDLNPSPAAPPP